MKRNKKRSNNKGFSLVELIVVIAIMAILVGVLAPQVMKYVGKSRTSTDNTNIESIKSAVQVALADEDAYADAVKLAGTSGFDFDFNGKEPVEAELDDGDFKDELTNIIGSYPSVKESSKTGFRVKIDSDMNVTVTTISSSTTE